MLARACPVIIVPLEDCFVVESSKHAFAWIDYAPAAARTAVVAGGYAAALVPLDGRTRLSRLARWLSMPWRVAAAERRVSKAGATFIVRYGVWPDAEQPTFVCQLDTDASAYADAQLLPEPNRVLRWIRARAAWLELCHPSLAAVVVIGRVA